MSANAVGTTASMPRHATQRLVGDQEVDGQDELQAAEAERAPAATTTSTAQSVAVILPPCSNILPKLTMRSYYPDETARRHTPTRCIERKSAAARMKRTQDR